MVRGVSASSAPHCILSCAFPIVCARFAAILNETERTEGTQVREPALMTCERMQRRGSVGTLRYLTVGAACLVAAAMAVAAALSCTGAFARGQREGSEVALEAVYRAAGGYSAGRYPVDRKALRAYLRHQTHGRLAQLSQSKASQVDAASSRQDSLERPIRRRGRRMQRAMESYLTHQPLSTVQKELRGQALNVGQIKHIKARSREHRSKIEEIAARILGGEVRRVRDTDGRCREQKHKCNDKLPRCIRERESLRMCMMIDLCSGRHLGLTHTVPVGWGEESEKHESTRLRAAAKGAAMCSMASPAPRARQAPESALRELVRRRPA